MTKRQKIKEIVQKYSKIVSKRCNESIQLWVWVWEEARPSSPRWWSISSCGSWASGRSASTQRPSSVLTMFLFKSCLHRGGTECSSFKKSQSLFTRARSLSLVRSNPRFFPWYLHEYTPHFIYKFNQHACIL